LVKAFIISVFMFLWGHSLFAQAPETLWTRTYGGPEDEYGYSICFNGHSGYVIAGHTESFGAGGRDVYLIKLAADMIGIDDA
jgi:hypothetical protein